MCLHVKCSQVRHVWVIPRDQKSMSDPQVMELQVGCKLPNAGSRTELGSSGRGASALTTEPSLQPHMTLAQTAPAAICEICDGCVTPLSMCPQCPELAL